MDAKMDAKLKEMKAGRQAHLKGELMGNLKTQIDCLASSIEVSQKNMDALLGEMKV
jgi:hypothetical protein